MKSIKNLRTRSLMWVAAGAVVGLSLGATGLVQAATDGSSDDTVAESTVEMQSGLPASDIGGSVDQSAGRNETPLTGEEASKVTAAAEAAAPGATVDRVETDDGGHAFEAHVTLADGTEKILFFNEAFEADGEAIAPAAGRDGGCPDGDHDGDRTGGRGDHAHDENGNDIPAGSSTPTDSATPSTTVND